MQKSYGGNFGKIGSVHGRSSTRESDNSKERINIKKIVTIQIALYCSKSFP